MNSQMSTETVAGGDDRIAPTSKDSEAPAHSAPESPSWAPSGGRLAGLAAEVVRAQAWFIALAVVYMLLGYGVAALYGEDFSVDLYSRFQLAVYLNLIVAFLVIRVGRAVYKHRPDRPLGFIGRDLAGDRALHRRIAHALPPLLLLPLAMSGYTSLKFMIPVIQPFAWDRSLAAWDALVHGGWQPWELLQPLIGSPLVTDWIDYAYGPPWFWMMIGLKFWLSFTMHPQRLRFLLAFLLSWLLLGNVAGTLLASVGPVYYGTFVDGADPFVPLLTYLDSVGETYRMLARLSQDYLWQAHMSRDLSLGVGISAMPSMHIAMGFFFVLVAWRYHWALRLVAVAYLLVLLVGSVHLAWHYAIDGYAGILGTYAIWWGLGRAFNGRR